MKDIVIRIIRWYQQFISLRNPFVRILLNTNDACRFHPTCSEYTCQAIEKHGIIRGLWIGLYRLFRCHPWSSGGYDPL